MLTKYAVALATLCSLPTEALAGRCDSYLTQADKASGAALVKAYSALVSCDVTLATESFPRVMLRATDMETLVPLTLTAIDGDVFGPVWNIMERLPYEHHVPLAEAVGAACTQHPKVVPFVQGAYTALKGSDFLPWKPTLQACTAPALGEWLTGLVVDPPKSPYNDKYNAVITTFAAIYRAEAVPNLRDAAILAGTRGGPFNNIIETIQQAVQPASFGSDIPPADLARMEEALVAIAKAVTPESARLVADRLYTAGNEPLAASLLPAVYPDRVQPDGTLLWAGVAVESCGGEAWVHWASFTSAPTRWAVTDHMAGPLRSAKAKLKCATDGPWPVIATDEPLRDTAAVEAWVAARVAELNAKGVKAKDVQEKKLSF
jgi:hypothetical protein